MSASAPASLIALICWTSSCGTCGRSSSASSAWRLRLMKRAWICGEFGVRRLEPLDPRHQKRPAVQELDHPEALLALRDDMVRAVLAGQVADDIGDGADPVEIDLARLVDGSVTLGEDADLPFGAHRVLRCGDRARPAERHRNHHARKQHELPHRHDGDRIGGDFPFGAGTVLGFLGGEGLDVGHGQVLSILCRRIRRHPSAASRFTAS